MLERFLPVLAIAVLFTAPALADPSPTPGPTGTGHPYDPCAMASKPDIADTTGVAVNQVYTPQAPTKPDAAPH